MSMSDQTDPVKQNIIDWCKEDNLKCVDESSDNPKHVFALSVFDSVSIYKQSHLPDRIYIQSQYPITEENKELMNKKPEIAKNIKTNLPKLASQYDVHVNFGEEKNILTRISIYKIHFHSTISKADFLRLFLRVHQVSNSIITQVSGELGLILKQESKKKPAPDASDVGIG